MFDFKPDELGHFVGYKRKAGGVKTLRKLKSHSAIASDQHRVNENVEF